MESESIAAISKALSARVKAIKRDLNERKINPQAVNLRNDLQSTLTSDVQIVKAADKINPAELRRIAEGFKGIDTVA